MYTQRIGIYTLILLLSYPALCFSEVTEYIFKVSIGGLGTVVSTNGADICEAIASVSDQIVDNAVSSTGSSGEPIITCYNYNANVCDSFDTCSYIYIASFSASPEKYFIRGTYDDKFPNMCVRDPIDPVSGNSIQLIDMFSYGNQHPYNFKLSYNGLSIGKWRHSFSYGLSRSQYQNTNRLVSGPNDSRLGSTEIPPEPGGGFGGNSGVFSNGTVNTAAYRWFLSRAEACTQGWVSYSKRYHYNWVPGSTAVLENGTTCKVVDAQGKTRMFLDVYSLTAGLTRSPGYSLPGYIAPPYNYLRFINPNGEVDVFFYSAGNWLNKSYTGAVLTEVVLSGGEKEYVLRATDDTIRKFDNQYKLVSITYPDGFVKTLSYDPVTGALATVTNSLGETLTFDYEAYDQTSPQKIRLSGVSDDTGRSWAFTYDNSGNLAGITNPEGDNKQFHYDDLADPRLMTGITDETGNRYVTWSYDTNGRANSSALGNTALIDKTDLTYDTTNGKTTVTVTRTSADASISTNISRIYKTQTSDAQPLVAEVSYPNCTNCAETEVTYEQDSTTGYPEYKIEHGVKTAFSNYDTKGNPGVIDEAVGLAEQRQTTYTYDSRYNSKITSITEASVFPGNNKITINTYDDFGNNTSVTINGYKSDGAAVSRATTFQYNGPYYQLTQIDGPRTDVSDIYTINYYPDAAIEGSNRARMKRVTAPINITLYDNITYTPTGKIKSYLNANNVQTTLSYFYGNDRLQSLSQVDLNTADSRLTEWTYLATGEVKTITTGVDATEKTTLTLNYDDARRLTSIVDGLGNTIEYILDSEGNVEQENVRDINGVLKKQLTQSFDDYNRLQLRTQVNEQLTETWSPNGTLDKTIDGKNVTTDYSYDNLRRLTQINQDMGGASPQTADALTILNYDVQDNLSYVSNSVNGETTFTYDDLGNQLTGDSDDTGLTTYNHDEAGNIISMLDANGETINYSYDALNRLTAITTSDAANDYLYEYDNCTNGAGRLCKASSNANAQFYQYDAFGNVASQQALQYTYDTANRLKTITYPSSAIVTYDYDAAGQIQQVSLNRNGNTVPLANNVSYEPFGDVNNLLYGNGLTLTQSKDTAYRPLTQNILDVFELNYTQYDENGNLEQRGDTVENTIATFGYDAHNRLNSVAGDFGVRAYEYDKNANRTKLTQDGIDATSTYAPASNRLSMRGVDNAVLDNNGNMLDLGSRSYSYTKHNRLFEVFDNGLLKATYQYNGLGQRISKTLPDGTGKYFIYDADGKLMAETDINGNVLFEYVFLNDQLLAKYTPDTDNDGISNYQEDQQGSNPSSPDSDNDGLSDLDEIFVYGTQINTADSDGDGVSDSEEVAFNSDPLNGNINIGDINLNGEFNLGDYVLLTQFVLGVRVPNPTEQAQADLNDDGVLNVQDMLLMQRVLLGLQVSWFGISTIDVESLFARLYQGIIPPAYAGNGDGEIYYVHNDHLGTPVKMTNELGFVVWVAVYDPFGKAVVDEDVDGDGVFVGMNLRFPGQYYDSESGLHYNYFRTYDPNLGRYITSDPIGLFGGINTYSYAYNNPLYWIDPFGLANLDVPLIGPTNDFGGPEGTITPGMIEGPTPPNAGDNPDMQPGTAPGITFTYPQTPAPGAIPLPPCFMKNCPPPPPPPCFLNCPPPPLPSCS